MDEPGVRVTWCDINNGIELASHKLIRLVTNWLYDALSLATKAFEHKDLYLRLPSGLTFKLIEDFQLHDFRISTVKYWGVKFWIMGMEYPTVPFPKIELDENFLINLLAPLNVAVDGSEDCIYYDAEADEYKLGTEFTPTRQYHILSDGGKDLGFIVLIMAICYFLTQVNLIDVAKEFMKKAMTYYGKFRNYLNHKRISDIYDILSEVEDISRLDEILEDIGIDLDNIKQLIGLRFRL